MLFSKIKDINYRIKYLKEEEKNKINKYIRIYLLTNFKSKKKIVNRHILSLLSSFKKSRTRLIRRCLLTNSTKSVSKPYNYSRSLYRNLIHFGIIPGYKKAVW